MCLWLIYSYICMSSKIYFIMSMCRIGNMSLHAYLHINIYYVHTMSHLHVYAACLHSITIQIQIYMSYNTYIIIHMCVHTCCLYMYTNIMSHTCIHHVCAIDDKHKKIFTMSYIYNHICICNLSYFCSYILSIHTHTHVYIYISDLMHIYIYHVYTMSHDRPCICMCMHICISARGIVFVRQHIYM